MWLCRFGSWADPSRNWRQCLVPELSPTANGAAHDDAGPVPGVPVGAVPVRHRPPVPREGLRSRAARRHRGKSDTVDARAAAFAVVSGRAAGEPESGGGQVGQIRVCKIAEDSAVKGRMQVVNQLRAMLVSADPALREQLSGPGKAALITRCAVLRDQAAAPDTVTCTLSLLARRIKNLDAEISDLLSRITGLVRAVTRPCSVSTAGMTFTLGCLRRRLGTTSPRSLRSTTAPGVAAGAWDFTRRASVPTAPEKETGRRAVGT